MEIVGTELKRAWDAYGKESVYISAPNEPGALACSPRFWVPAQVWSRVSIEVSATVWILPLAAVALRRSNETRDWVNAKTIILSGINFLETSHHAFR